MRSARSCGIRWLCILCSPRTKTPPYGRAVQARLADAERAELRQQAARFEARLAADAGDAGALRGAGAAALALGEPGRAAALLVRLANAAPADGEAWQLLVRSSRYMTYAGSKGPGPCAVPEPALGRHACCR